MMAKPPRLSPARNGANAHGGGGHDMAVPRGFLLGIGALVLFALVLTGVSRLTGFGASRVALPDAMSTLSVQFVDLDDGLVEAREAQSGRVLAQWGTGEGGFVRVTLRGLARERRALGVGAEPPFVLAHDASGRLFLSDPQTGHQVTLDAFGRDNAQQFKALFAAAAEAERAGTQSLGDAQGGRS
jgi:putative photosynthetic complex assembly protein